MSLRRPIVFSSIALLLIYISVGYILITIAVKNENKQMLPIEVCLTGMNSIFENNPNLELLNSSVIKGLKDNSSFEVNELHLVKQINPYECDVFTRDNKGVRRFYVKLEKSSSFIHLYKILDIKERKIDARYQL